MTRLTYVLAVYIVKRLSELQGAYMTRFSFSCGLVLALFFSPAVRAQMNHGTAPAVSATAGTSTLKDAPVSPGEAMLEKVQSLIGTWDAPTSGGVMTDVFKPFALGTAVLGEEWINGKQITATVFYVVGSELRVDHYCDFLNQPRYTAVPSMDPADLDFEFRDATNLDTHSAHFHTTKWHIADATHLTQDWYILGGKKPVSLVHMEFIKRPAG